MTWRARPRSRKRRPPLRPLPRSSLQDRSRRPPPKPWRYTMTWRARPRSRKRRPPRRCRRRRRARWSCRRRRWRRSSGRRRLWRPRLSHPHPCRAPAPATIRWWPPRRPRKWTPPPRRPSNRSLRHRQRLATTRRATSRSCSAKTSPSRRLEARSVEARKGRTASRSGSPFTRPRITAKSRARKAGTARDSTSTSRPT